MNTETWWAMVVLAGFMVLGLSLTVAGGYFGNVFFLAVAVVALAFSVNGVLRSRRRSSKR